MVVNNELPTDNSSDTEMDPILLAADQGDLEELKSLALKGYDIHVSNDLALGWAAEESENFEMVKYLIDNGANPNKFNDALACAVQSGNFDMVKYMIDHCQIENIDANDSGALVSAVDNNRLDMVKILIENGSDPTFENHFVIKEAAEYGYSDIFEYLKTNTKFKYYKFYTDSDLSKYHYHQSEKCKKCISAIYSIDVMCDICNEVNEDDIPDIIDQFIEYIEENYPTEYNQYLKNAYTYPDINLQILKALSLVMDVENMSIDNEIFAEELSDLSEEDLVIIYEYIEDYMSQANAGKFDRVEISVKIISGTNVMEETACNPLNGLPIEVVLDDTAIEAGSRSLSLIPKL